MSTRIYELRVSETNWMFEVAHALRLADIPFELDMSLRYGVLDIAITKGTKLYGVVEIERKVPRAKLIHKVPSITSKPGDKITGIIDTCKGWLKKEGMSYTRKGDGNCSSAARIAMMKQIANSLELGSMQVK